MLPLAEQLMLLALHDEKGSVVFSASTALPYGLAGAILLDLFFQDRITLKGKKIQVIDSAQIGEPTLDEALSLIQSSARNRDAKYWIGKISSKVKDLKQRITDNLVQQNIVKREGRRILWVFNVDRYPTLNAAPEMEIRNRIRNIILLNQTPTEEEAALISLVIACELVNEVFAKEERKTAKRRIKELTESEQIGKAVSAVVTEMILAITAAVTTTIIAASVTTSASS